MLFEAFLEVIFKSFVGIGIQIECEMVKNEVLDRGHVRGKAREKTELFPYVLHLGQFGLDIVQRRAWYHPYTRVRTCDVPEFLEKTAFSGVFPFTCCLLFVFHVSMITHPPEQSFKYR